MQKRINVIEGTYLFHTRLLALSTGTIVFSEEIEDKNYIVNDFTSQGQGIYGTAIERICSLISV